MASLTETDTGDPVPKRQPRLWVVFHPTHAGQVLAVPWGTHRLGREGDFTPEVFAVGRISRKHARLERTGEGVRVTDLGSHNGTRVNGVAVKSTLLSDGDVLRLGPVVLVARWEVPEPEARPIVGLAGHGDAHRRLLHALERAAAAGRPTLLVGESGVGKGRCIAAVQRDAASRHVLDGATVVDGVGVASLFGQVDGAFPGAAGRDGAIAAAGDGLLVLDHLDLAPPGLQRAVVQWLGEGRYCPVGSDRARPAACRVVATATSLERLPPALVARFPSLIEIPPLRARREDIAAIALSVEPELSAQMLEALLARPWPGNGRELVQWLHRRRAAGRLDEVPDQAPAPKEEARPGRPSAARLQRLLEAHGGNIRRTSAALGVARTTLYRWLEAEDISLDDYRP